MNISEIRNKQKRHELFLKQSQRKSKSKKADRERRKKLAEELGAAAPPKPVPRTQESTREKEETIVDEEDEEYIEDIEGDEFSDYFSGLATPKILLTTRPRPSRNLHVFLGELMNLIPHCYYYRRKTSTVKDLMAFGKTNGYTHMIVVSEKNKIVDGLLLSHLRGGPTAAFRITRFVASSDIKGHGNATDHFPEIVCNRFVTRLGKRVSRLLGSVFPHNPQFPGRRVVTFHNQRDFIFVRQHRYIFDSSSKARLQELGPRFTLKFRSLQADEFNSVSGEYEWVYSHRRLDTSRRKFHL